MEGKIVRIENVGLLSEAEGWHKVIIPWTKLVTRLDDRLSSTGIKKILPFWKLIDLLIEMPPSVCTLDSSNEVCCIKIWMCINKNVCSKLTIRTMEFNPKSRRASWECRANQLTDCRASQKLSSSLDWVLLPLSLYLKR